MCLPVVGLRSGVRRTTERPCFDVALEQGSRGSHDQSDFSQRE